MGARSAIWIRRGLVSGGMACLLLLLAGSEGVAGQGGTDAMARMAAAAGPPAGASVPALVGVVADGRTERPVAGAVVVLRRMASAGEATGEMSSRRPQAGAPAAFRTVTGRDGSYGFYDLERSRYELTVERLSYHPVTVDVTLERDEPLSVSILLEPDPFPLGPVDPSVGKVPGPTLTGQPPGEADQVAAGERMAGERAAAIRVRQIRFLASDARQLGREDLREANTLAEFDLFRALQRNPGVSTRDDYSADLWIRGAAAGQMVVRFDGIPVMGGLHALGALSGLNTDMLSTATFLPGVASASLQGAGAGVVDVTSRSGEEPGGGTGSAALSALSARASAGGRASDRIAWAIGARRSHLDALSRLARSTGVTSHMLPYVFMDVSGRVDVRLGDGTKVEASGFWQDDGVFGDVPDVAYGNEGNWGARAGRASLLVPVGALETRHTFGVSRFDASVETTSSPSHLPSPLHPPTENHYRTLVWESRIERRPEEHGGWSMGVRVTHEDHQYRGPGIDLARLVSHEELARRGIGDLTPLLQGLQGARLTHSADATRAALWGERRERLAEHLELEAGLRVETGHAVQGDPVRLAPRLRFRWSAPGSPLAVALGYGRAWQYVQSVARTDVLRPGLRVSELFVQAGADMPALRSDLLTFGGEAWAGAEWLLGATLWGRASAGILLPDPAPGVIDGTRAPVAARGRAWGIDVSARKVEGRVRGFVSYSLSRSRHNVGARLFDASEDRRHVTNIGVMMDATKDWRVGGTLRAQSGAPYTRITLMEPECNEHLGCDGAPPVLYGAPNAQRGRAYVGLDLVAEWTHRFGSWSFTAYGQLRNVLGRSNRVTYHASCVCSAGEQRGFLRDRFDRGLPRLPLIGVRARF